MPTNILQKALISVIKVFALIAVAWLTSQFFYVKNSIQLGICVFNLIFITLPTIFIIFFRRKCFEKWPKFHKICKVLLFVYILAIVLYTVSLSLGLMITNDKRKTQKTIDFITSQKITLDDVMGKNLPPKPDQTLNDSTIAGIDANENYIRDDVELAIFEKYPDSAKIRAAELQYAQALQLELTQVFNSKTLVPVMQKGGRGINCIGQVGPDVSLKDSREEIIAALAVTDDMQEEVKNSVLNTDLREKKYSDIYEKYMTGYASSQGEECDIEPSSLPN